MNAPSFSPAGRRALITGPSQSIGLTLAHALAGASVILNGQIITGDGGLSAVI